jgi:hypothetical protein
LLPGFAANVGVLHADYASLSTIMRTGQHAMNRFPLMLPALLFIGSGFTWIYSARAEKTSSG